MHWFRGYRCYIVFISSFRLETTKLLLKNGANYNAESRYGDDALQMACLKGAKQIFEYLTSNIKYSPEKLANAHELIGATFLDEQNDVTEALSHWKEALLIRQTYGMNKIFNNSRSFTSRFIL